MADDTSSAPDRLAFRDGDRAFDCAVGPRCRTDASRWWWFSVSTGGTSRYALFEADVEDTSESVRTRVIAQYDDMLARRAAAPAYQRWRKATPAAVPVVQAELPALPMDQPAAG